MGAQQRPPAPCRGQLLRFRRQQLPPHLGGVRRARARQAAARAAHRTGGAERGNRVRSRQAGRGDRRGGAIRGEPGPHRVRRGPGVRRLAARTRGSGRRGRRIAGDARREAAHRCGRRNRRDTHQPRYRGGSRPGARGQDGVPVPRPGQPVRRDGRRSGAGVPRGDRGVGLPRRRSGRPAPRGVPRAGLRRRLARGAEGGTDRNGQRPAGDRGDQPGPAGVARGTRCPRRYRRGSQLRGSHRAGGGGCAAAGTARRDRAHPR